ncbi:hypothetical protein EPUL_005150, partial [Erysiphe pulchra]
MDDVVIFSKSLQEHICHLQIIFRKVKEFNLKIQLDKSEFLSKSVEFLGHVITPDGISPNPTKLKAVENYPIPRTVKEIKSFLGLIGYYRRFIQNFAHIVSPLTKCLKKGSKIKTDDPEYEHSFHLCKELLTNAPILVYPDFNKPFTLTTDASNVAIGSVLSQCNHPVAYYSRTLNSAERNYSTIEKELLSILDSTKHFRPYLYGQSFTIETDHNPLVWLYKIKEPNSRLIRWKLKLDEFDFNIVHKKGKENKVADALSRVEINNRENENSLLSEGDLDIEIASILPNVNELPVLTDEELENILSSPNNQPNDEIDSNATIHSTQEDNGKVIPITESSVNIYPNRIILNIGEQYKLKFTKIFKKNTYNISIRQNFMKNDFSKFLEEILRPNETYGIFFRDDKLRIPFVRFCKKSFNYSVKFFISNTLLLDVPCEENQSEIISEYHDKNHNGISETYSHLSKKYYWPKMRNKITEIINKCELCLQSKYERHPYKLKFSGPLLAKRPFEVIHIDTFSFQNSKFLTIIDLFSKYAQSYFVKDGTALTMLNKLRHYFSHHNIPQKIVCDEGREFQNKTFTEFCKLNKINLHFTTVNNPSSNSPIERFHSTILEKLRVLKLSNPTENPANLMITATLIYNQSIHSATGYSPFHLLYGPYDKLPEFDLTMTVYEQYNEKRKQEILPFFDLIYKRNEDKAKKTLTRLNENRNDPPNLEQKEVYVERNRPRKTDPPFEKITVHQQNQNKISGLTSKSRETTAHIRNVKKLRKKRKGIKFITGNLDDDDLKTINENLEMLHKSKSSEIEKINKLTSFANHLSQRYSEDLTLLNENIIHTKFIFRNLASIDEFRTIVEYQIIQSESLLNILLMLERTISFAMNEIPNLEIIKVEELLSIESYLEHTYKTQQLSPIDVHLFKIIEFAKMAVIGTEETISFLLKIPILKQVIANYSRVYPLPNHQDIAVIPPKMFSIKIHNEEYWTDEPCKTTLGSSM